LIITNKGKRTEEIVAINDLIDRQYNLIEGTGTVSTGQLGSVQVDFRYRPAVSATGWQVLEPIVPSWVTDIEPRIQAAGGPDGFRFLLTLTSLQQSSIHYKRGEWAVFQGLYHSISMNETIAEKIRCLLEYTCPVVTGHSAWGYANVVPFRDLSVAEEWKISVATSLLSDLSRSQQKEHHYLFAAHDAKPPVPLPDNAIVVNDIIIYELPPRKT
jgi:hypothetical protein